ncbi:hypothetical protein ACWOE3_11280 [Enterococcus dispar]|uniref:Excisionase n=1 Tax=Enterococcus dispar ATCC 51266 TaxID=1139219 RepID=S0KG15_9ENTE|nr:hypothetical protein [Enterococcus dispar]EOT43774.1 hypothetical protein OMK_00332 [Enterococcus dispar ATCC 51266]EOW85554.1 hypothetical protein I569_00867 [Enterococcus dispar ATCC 51266]
MDNLLTKAEFLEKMGYSESTYQRRMKKFKVPKYRNGYLAVTSNEVYIDEKIYEQFMRDESAKKFHYERFEVKT